jgi:hypothetical protein
MRYETALTALYNEGWCTYASKCGGRVVSVIEADAGEFEPVCLTHAELFANLGTRQDER